MKSLCLALIASTLVAALVDGSASAEEIDVTAQVRRIKQVGPQGAGHRDAMDAWKVLARAEGRQLPEMLAAMAGAGPLATNWLRAAVETVAQRAEQSEAGLPVAALEEFLADTSQMPRARRLAYELIARVDSNARRRLIPPLLNDPSLELRRDAVAMALQHADQLREAGEDERAISAYRSAFSSARDLDQVQQAAKRLEAFGEEVDLAAHFGFVQQWWLIAPFDNKNQGGFDVPYPPEKEIDLTRSYAGSEGEISWKQVATEDPLGIVELNALVGKYKGAICYAYAEFEADRERDVELRLGCINGNKVWLNGKLLTANHVYHANMFVDQYVGKGRLKKGKNSILLKIAQNEQTENWAQRWQFQLRVCDELGTAVLSQDRPLEKTAARLR